MFGNNKEKWKELCERAAAEQDPTKLLDLITEINRLLAEKEQRLVANRGSGVNAPSDSAESTSP